MEEIHVGTGKLRYLPVSLMALTVCLGGAASAVAQIVHVDVGDITVSSGNPNIPLDLTGNGTPEFVLEYQSGPVSGANVRAVGLKAINGGIGFVGYTQDVFGTNLPFASALAADHVISSTQVDSAAFCVRVAIGFITNTSGTPAWRQGGAYFGFAFQMSDGVNPPTTHFGWGRAVANNTCSWATFTEFAYESSAETPILAGDMGTLPVELVMFEAIAQERDVTLKWRTASETANSGFEIYHRFDGAFRSVGFVEGAGTSRETQAYTYHLTDLLPGTHQFRLKQIDTDGTVSFSPEVEATVNVPATFLLTSAYPNPFNPRTQFSLSVARSQEVSVEVFDMLGRRVAVLHHGVLEAGRAREFAFDGTSLPSGIYVIQARGQTFVGTEIVTMAK